MPKRSTRVYVFGNEVFVAHPATQALWIRTHVCVIRIACETCRAAVGEPCRGKNSDWLSWTHHTRRRAAKQLGPFTGAAALIIR